MTHGESCKLLSTHGNSDALHCEDALAVSCLRAFAAALESSAGARRQLVGSHEKSVGPGASLTFLMVTSLRASKSFPLGDSET